MEWVTTLVSRLADLGPWGVLIFIVLYVASAVFLAPSFILTMGAGALFGIVRGSVLVYVAATLGASAAYAVALRLSRVPLVARLDGDRRVIAVREAVAGQGAYIQVLLRLSPLVPFNLLNYALGFSRVRYRDFLGATPGMIPAIVMYTYYGRVVGDIAALAAGVAPPRGPEYYVLLGVGLVATVVATTLITRAARRAIERQRGDRSAT